jgi:hypothetical protein
MTDATKEDMEKSPFISVVVWLVLVVATAVFLVNSEVVHMSEAKQPGTVFLKFMEAKAQEDAAFQLYCYAGSNLELKRLQARAAELASQHEPMAEFSGCNDAIREQILRAVQYVMTGRKE